MEYFLGIDVGTTSIKALAVDADGVITSSAQIPCRLESPKPGYFEIDAPTQWKGGTLKALEALGASILDDVKAICISSVCASFVPEDETGSTLRNAILYGIDTRSIKQVERLNATVNKKSIASIAGNGFTSHSVLPKILWLKENEPEIYKSTARFVESSNYLTSLLTSQWAWDMPSAAGGHMIDAEKGAYPEDLLSEIGIDIKKLPPLKQPLENLGFVTEHASARTGLPAGIPVLVGACDINAEAFACGAFDPGSLLVVYGSTVSTLYTIDSFKRLPGFLTGPSILKGTYRLGGATSSGGRYIDWLKKLFGGSSIPDLSKVTAPTEVVMLPFLDGARLPYQNPTARVLWDGMSSATDKETIWKAAFESLGCELFDLLGHFSKAGEIPEFAYITGGLATNKQFLQILSDVSGLRLLHFKNINAAFGDALMALSSCYNMERARTILSRRRTDSCETIEPDRRLFASYERTRERYMTLLATASR